MKPHTFSVILAALNEQQRIRTCIRSIRAAHTESEIIVVDGGSVDATTTIVRDEGAILVDSDSGRGIQLNRGALTAHGDVFVFLHADSVVSPDFFDVLSVSFDNSLVDIGTCVLRFNVRHPVLRWYERCARVKSVFTTFGDQCIVVRRSFFERIGGFPAWPLFEDVRFLQTARKSATIYTFPTVVETSARKFVEHGLLAQQLRNAVFMALYLAGVAPERLAPMYTRQATGHGPITKPAQQTIPYQPHKRSEELCNHYLA